MTPKTTVSRMNRPTTPPLHIAVVTGNRKVQAWEAAMITRLEARDKVTVTLLDGPDSPSPQPRLHRAIAWLDDCLFGRFENPCAQIDLAPETTSTTGRRFDFIILLTSFTKA